MQGNRLTEAIMDAAIEHDGQTDKQGQPYILHCLRVMLQMSTEDERIVAVLHDTLEDTNYDEGTILAKFGEEVLTAIKALTRVYEPRKEVYSDYILRVKQNPLARRVKIADLRDNMSKERISKLPPQERDVLGRYKRAIKVLESEDEAAKDKKAS